MYGIWLKKNLGLITITMLMVLGVVGCNLTTESTSGTQETINQTEEISIPTLKNQWIYGFEANPTKNTIELIQVNGKNVKALDSQALEELTREDLLFSYATNPDVERTTTPQDTGACKPVNPNFVPESKQLNVEFCFLNQSGKTLTGFSYQLFRSDNVTKAMYLGTGQDLKTITDWTTSVTSGSGNFDNDDAVGLLSGEASKPQVFSLTYENSGTVVFYISVQGSYIAAPEGIRAEYTNSAVMVSWDVLSEATQNLKIERAVNGGEFTELATIDGSLPNYGDSNVQENTDYSYRIVALNAGAGSVPSEVVTARKNTLQETATDENKAALRIKHESIESIVAIDNSAMVGSSVSISANTINEPLTGFEDTVYKLQDTIEITIPKNELNLTGTGSLLITPDSQEGTLVSAVAIISIDTVDIGWYDVPTLYQPNVPEAPIRVESEILKMLNNEYKLTDPVKIKVDFIQDDFSSDSSESGSLQTQDITDLFDDLAKQPLGLFHLPAFDNLDYDTFDESCDSQQGLNYTTGKVSSDQTNALEDKTPVIFIHGWQVLEQVGNSLVAALSVVYRPTTYYSPHLCAWTNMMDSLKADSEITDDFEFYTFSWNSFDRLVSSRVELENAISTAFPNQEVVLITHSTGGIIARDYEQLHPEKVNKVIPIAGPLKGIDFLLCTEVTSGLCTQSLVDPEFISGLNVSGVSEQLVDLAGSANWLQKKLIYWSILSWVNLFVQIGSSLDLPMEETKPYSICEYLDITNDNFAHCSILTSKGNPYIQSINQGTPDSSKYHAIASKSPSLSALHYLLLDYGYSNGIGLDSDGLVTYRSGVYADLPNSGEVNAGIPNSTVSNLNHGQLHKTVVTTNIVKALLLNEHISTSGTCDNPTGLEIEWRGSISNDWNTPLNWSSATVPTPTDDVLICSTTNLPIRLTQTANVNHLATGAGTTIDLNGKYLLVNGDLNVTGSFSNAGTVRMNGSSVTVSGNISKLDIGGSVILTEDISLNELTIHQSGSVVVNGKILTVNEFLDIRNQRTASTSNGLIMTNPSDVVNVKDIKIRQQYDNTSSEGIWSAGELHVMGNFDDNLIAHRKSSGFISTGTKVFFEGTTPQTVAKFGGLFKDIDISNSAGVYLGGGYNEGGFIVDGKLRMIGNGVLIGNNAASGITYNNEFPLITSGYQVPNTVIGGSMLSDATTNYAGKVSIGSNYTLTLNANLTVDDLTITQYGSLIVNGNTLTVNEFLDITNQRTGTTTDLGLIMTNASDVVNVKDIKIRQTHDYSSSEGTLSAGVLHVTGDFDNDGNSSRKAYSFISTGTKVVFEGISSQTVIMHGSSRNHSRFEDVDISNSVGVNFQDSIFLDGNLSVLELLNIGANFSISVDNDILLANGSTLANSGVVKYCGNLIDQGGTIIGNSPIVCSP